MKLSLPLLPLIAKLAYGAPAADSLLTPEVNQKAPPPTNTVFHYEASFDKFATPSLLPVGISYANAPTYVYGGLKYSTKWKIANIGKDFLSNLKPPTPENVLALPGTEPGHYGASWSIDTIKHTFGIYGFYFACAADVVGNPEALACFITVSCQTESQVLLGIEYPKYYPYTGSSEFAYAPIDRIMPTKDATCSVSLRNATTILTGKPYTGSALILIDRFNYYFNTTAPK